MHKRNSGDQETSTSTQDLAMEDMFKLLLQQQVQQQQMQQQQQRLLEALLQKQLADSPTTAAAPRNYTVDIPPFDPNMDDNLENWIVRFECALGVSAPSINDQDKVKCIISKLSSGALDDYLKYCMPKKPTEYTYAETLEQLTKTFGKTKTLVLERYNVMRIKHGDDDDYAKHFNRVKAEHSRSKFFEMTYDQQLNLLLLASLPLKRDESVRTRIMHQLNSNPNITHEALTSDILAMIATKAEQSQMEDPQPRLNAVSKGNRSRPQSRNRQGPRSSSPSRSPKRDPPYPCYRCGGNHWIRDCKHANHVCSKCSTKGHLDSQCGKYRERSKNQHRNKSRSIYNIQVPAVRINAFQQSKLINGRFLVNEVPITFCIDSGAEANIINEETYAIIGKPRLQQCHVQGLLFDGSTSTLLGKGRATFRLDDLEAEQEFFLAKAGSLNLIGVHTLDYFGLLDSLRKRFDTDRLPINAIQSALQQDTILSSLKTDFADVFKDGLGLCTRAQATLQLKPDAVPVYRRARPVPYASRDIIDKELDRLIGMDVIRPVDYTEWAAPVMVVRKSNGSARLCVDFSTGLNDALQPHQHPLPLPEDIFATLNGGRIFSQLDLSDAYLQIELDDASKALCSISTHRGNFQYQRLPFGIKSAPGIFQSIMDNMLAGLPFALAYLDDVIIVSRNQDEHQQHLKAVFARFKYYGFRLRLPKCTFFMKSIKYLGFIIDSEGRRPNPEKIQAIANMPTPTDVPTLRSFLGMINYYQAFVYNMRSIRQPLDELLQKNKTWKWTQTCQNAFDKLKDVLQSDLLLTHYDPTLDLIVAADASNYGIGAVLQHRFPDGSIKAVSHASRALSPAERNYSQIEKEGLALIYAVKKFHKMLHGRHFTLLTDHKPLLAIYGNKKGIPVHTANRLQRWAIILIGYDFNIEYRNTTSFGQADALSRLIANQKSAEDDIVLANIALDVDVAAIIRQLPLTYTDIRDATLQDDLLRNVMHFIRTGWPDSKQLKQDPSWPQLQQLYHRRDNISIQKDCLLFDERVIIPNALQNRVLRLLHHGHPGIKRMKSLGRRHAYWPLMDQQIEKLVQQCNQCALAAKQPPKTTLESWPIATKPWQRLHIDYAGPHHGDNFLVIVDAFSKFPEIFAMKSTTSDATITALRGLFARYGLPEIIVSDNGTQFASSSFKKFCEENGVQHIFTPPYHPQSNGQAERFVDTLKRALIKLKGEGNVQQLLDVFLGTYRTTPNDRLNGKCPAELFLGRPTRTTLDLLHPPARQPTERDEAMERQFDLKHGARRRTFKIGELVYARHHRTQPWKAGRIIEEHGVVYHVLLDDGATNRFHANQLRHRAADTTEDPYAVIMDAFELPTLAITSAAKPILPQPPSRSPRSERHVQFNLPEPEQDGPARVVTPPEANTRPRRTKKKPFQLNVDPKRKTYLQR